MDRPFQPIRTLGISVMPGYLQSEGPRQVLDRLVGVAGVNDITFYPQLLEPCADRQGIRHPPHDGDDGHVRLFDRPVWGRREFWARNAPSHEPDMSLFQGLRYRPHPADAVTHRDGHLVREFLREAKAAGVRLVLQAPATIPARRADGSGRGPADEDLPRLPDGRIPDMQVDRFGSLASDDIIAFTAANLVDLTRAYPEVDAIRLDWPEYPPYTLDNVFCDFSDHARRAADELGFDFERMRRDAAAAYEALNGDLQSLLEAAAGNFGADATATLLDRWPALPDLFAFKRALSLRLVKRYRNALDAAGATNVGIVPQGFPEPWNYLSGFDPDALAPFSVGIGVKFYTMHWPMIVRYFARALEKKNPATPPAAIFEHLVRGFDLTEANEPVDPDRFRYPDPATGHPIASAAMTRKARGFVQASQDRVPLFALSHSYGPLDDFQRRLKAVLDGGMDRIWVQRYAYLSDEKLAWLGALPRA